MSTVQFATSLADARHSIQVELESDPDEKGQRARLTLWLHWHMRVEGSPFHRKAWGSLWSSTDEAGNNRYPVDFLSITLEMPNLTGGTETNKDAKPGDQVDAFCEAYGTSFTVPSFTARYWLFMRHTGFQNWYNEDTLSL